MLFAICLIMMTALNWVMPIGAIIVIGIFMLLEMIKHVRPKNPRKAKKPKTRPRLLDDGCYRR